MTAFTGITLIRSPSIANARLPFLLLRYKSFSYACACACAFRLEGQQ